MVELWKVKQKRQLYDFKNIKHQPSYVGSEYVNNHIVISKLLQQWKI